MKKHFLTTVLLFCTIQMYAQNSEEKSVASAINKLFEGMNKSDTLLMQSIIAQGGRLETVVKNKNGEVSVRKESFDGFYKSVAKAPVGALDERLTTIETKIDGDLAVAWTPYRFYYNGQFSHCGVNVFQLVRLGGQWKIWSIIDTRRKEGCEDKK